MTKLMPSIRYIFMATGCIIPQQMTVFLNAFPCPLPLYPLASSKLSSHNTWHILRSVRIAEETSWVCLNLLDHKAIA